MRTSLFRAQPSLDPEQLPSLRLEGWTPVARPRLRGTLLLARSVLRYRFFDLTPVAQADRQGALTAQLLAWQPYPDARYLVQWQSAGAQVFAWPQEALASVPGKWTQLLPESVCHGDMPDGLHLLRGLQGFEGQAWRKGQLLASRWWKTLPDDAQWLAFARQSRLGSEALVPRPEPAEPAWQMPARPWRDLAGLARADGGTERVLRNLGAMVLCAFSAFVAHDAWDARQQWQAQQEAAEAMREQVAPVIKARDLAMSRLDQARAIQAQLDAPSSLELFEELRRLLPPGVTVPDLQLQGQSLTLNLQLPPDVSRTQLIGALEGGGWFRDVKESKDSTPRSGLTLEMKLQSLHPPERPMADAGLKRSSTEVGTPPSAPVVVVPPAAATGGKK